MFECLCSRSFLHSIEPFRFDGPNAAHRKRCHGRREAPFDAEDRGGDGGMRYRLWSRSSTSDLELVTLGSGPCAESGWPDAVAVRGFGFDVVDRTEGDVGVGMTSDTDIDAFILRTLAVATKGPKGWRVSEGGYWLNLKKVPGMPVKKVKTRHNLSGNSDRPWQSAVAVKVGYGFGFGLDMEVILTRKGRRINPFRPTRSLRVTLTWHWIRSECQERLQWIWLILNELLHTIFLIYKNLWVLYHFDRLFSNASRQSQIWTFTVNRNGSQKVVNDWTNKLQKRKFFLQGSNRLLVRDTESSCEEQDCKTSLACQSPYCKVTVVETLV